MIGDCGMRIGVCGLMKGARHKTQGTRQEKTHFLPCALRLEPYASLDAGY